MPYLFMGPSFSIGDKIRVKETSRFLFTHELLEGVELSVLSTRTEDVPDYPDGMPYTNEFSHQLISVNGFADSTKEVSASHFELAN